MIVATSPEDHLFNDTPNTASSSAQPMTVANAITTPMIPMVFHEEGDKETSKTRQPRPQPDTRLLSPALAQRMTTMALIMLTVREI
jgi:hypothetical protein